MTTNVTKVHELAALVKAVRALLTKKLLTLEVRPPRLLRRAKRREKGSLIPS